MFLLLLCLITAFDPVRNDFPTDFPELVPLTCTSITDCTIFTNSNCGSGQTCTSCTVDSQCDHISSPGACFSGECQVSCSPTSSEDCWAMRMICDPNLARCIQCSADNDCADFPGQHWCQQNGGVNFCVSCRNDADCTTGICKNMRCEQCTSDLECSAPTSVCLKTFSTTLCVACIDNSYCPSSTASSCINNNCVPCTSSLDCQHITGKPYCSAGKCVECTDSSQCADVTESYCDQNVGLCMPCSRDNDCTRFTTSPYCSLGMGCVQCLSSTQCTTASRPYCDTSIGVCKSCRDNNDCTKFPTTQACANSGRCVECTDSIYCKTPEKSVCNQDLNTCEVCSDNFDCIRFPTKAFCSINSIGCIGCSSDSQCGDITQFYCDTSDTTCKPYRLSPQELKKMETLSTIGDATGVTATVAIMLSNVLSPGDSGGVSGGILAKILQYIKYININYSLRLEAMFKLYHSSPGSITFLAPDMPESVKMDFPYQEVPPKFAEYNVHSSFIVNFWNNLISFLILSSVFAIIRVLEWAWKNKSPKNKLRTTSRLIRIAAQNFLILQFYNIYCDVVLFSGLEITTTEWDSGTSIVSFFTSLIITFFGLALFYVHFVTLYRYQNRRQKKEQGKRNPELESYLLKNEGFKAFFEQFKDDSFIRQVFLLVFAVRSALSNLIIVFLFKYPLAQAVLIISMTAVIFIYLIAMRPFKTIVNFTQQMTYETLFLIANACLLALAVLDNSESPSASLQDNLCDVIVIVSLIFGFVPNLFVVAKLVSVIIDFYKLRKLKHKTPENSKSNLSRFNTKTARRNQLGLQNHYNTEMIKTNNGQHQMQYISNDNNESDNQTTQKKPKIKRVNKQTEYGKEIEHNHKNNSNFDSLQVNHDNSISLANSSIIQLLNVEEGFDFQKTVDQTNITTLINQESPVRRNRTDARRERKQWNLLKKEQKQ